MQVWVQIYAKATKDKGLYKISFIIEMWIMTQSIKPRALLMLLYLFILIPERNTCARKR